MKKSQTKTVIDSLLDVFDFEPRVPTKKRIDVLIAQQEVAQLASSSWLNVWDDMNTTIARRRKALESVKG